MRVRGVAVTCGPRPVQWREGASSGSLVPPRARAIDTLGAGDVFHGALLACLVRGLELRPALERANRCAALSCRALDGRSAIPTWEELA